VCNRVLLPTACLIASCHAHRFLQSHPVPVVLGPGGRHYLIDHHHLARAMHEKGIKACYAGEAPWHRICFSALSACAAVSRFASVGSTQWPGCFVCGHPKGPAFPAHSVNTRQCMTELRDPLCAMCLLLQCVVNSVMAVAMDPSAACNKRHPISLIPLCMRHTRISASSSPMATTVHVAGTVLDLSELTQEQFWVAMVGLTQPQLRLWHSGLTCVS
jgi:hypothetical protein